MIFGERERVISEISKRIYEERIRTAKHEIQQKLKPFLELYGNFEGREKFEEFGAGFLDSLLESNTEINESDDHGGMQATVKYSMPEYTLNAYVSTKDSWILQLKVGQHKLQAEVTNRKLVEVVVSEEQYTKAQVIRGW